MSSSLISQKVKLQKETNFTSVVSDSMDELCSAGPKPG